MLFGVVALLVVVGCNKKEDRGEAPKRDTPGAGASTASTGSGHAAAANTVGVAAGGIAYDADDGPVAVLTAVSGKVEVRRTGEPVFATAKANLSLHAGDAIRTGESSTAAIVLADDSAIQVAEVTTVGVASRAGGADPASSAAVLSGLARFTVTARAPAEGAFRIYTPGGVILTSGATVGVGVAASGDARVGVEAGQVEILGLADLTVAPIELDAGMSLALGASGALAAPAQWPSDDWGVWRDEVDADVKLVSALQAHGAALASLDAELVASYADLDATATAVAAFETSAAASAAAGTPATYQASLPEGAATIDASFAVAGRVELLTWAYAAHATLATDLYVRHPTELAATWSVMAPQVDAAVLWPKRFEITTVGYLEPLRMQYYVHHPRGRLHAELVGVTVPEFYAQIEPPTLEPAKIRAHVKAHIWMAPEVTYHASTRAVWIAAPSASWRAHANFEPAKLRGSVAWYVRPPTLRATAMVGATVGGTYTSNLDVRPPEPRASLRARWSIPVGMQIKVSPPNLDAAASARARVKFDASGGLDHSVVARASVKAPSIDVKAPAVDVKVKVKAAGKAAVDAADKAAADVRARLDVRPPTVNVKVKAPSIKIQGQASGSAGIKLGN
ncbi:MAG TPA: FecR family protein [Kofleriaceae bacterium]|nr:FecR family protein [Kofleriaceae bacterium]